MVDETGQVSEEILKQTQEILEFAAQKTGKENKEMAVTFVSNARSHELNLEYRDTDRPTDVISLEYKPELDIAVDEEDGPCISRQRFPDADVHPAGKAQIATGAEVGEPAEHVVAEGMTTAAG